RSPAVDPDAGATLLNYLSRPNVRQQGVEIKGEAVVRGEHTLYMIVESSDEKLVQDFLEPFAMAGTVEVYPASTCAGVVAAGGCAATMPDLEGAGTAFDPEDAFPRAGDAGLVCDQCGADNCARAKRAFLGDAPDAYSSH